VELVSGGRSCLLLLLLLLLLLIVLPGMAGMPAIMAWMRADRDSADGTSLPPVAAASVAECTATSGGGAAAGDGVSSGSSHLNSEPTCSKVTIRSSCTSFFSLTTISLWLIPVNRVAVRDEPVDSAVNFIPN
jgi:hypothetical protein